MLQGCAWITATPVDHGDRSVAGVPFYPSLPYLSVSASAEGMPVTSIVWMPDYCQPYRLKMGAFLSKLDVDVSFEHSTITDLESSVDATAATEQLLALANDLWLRERSAHEMGLVEGQTVVEEGRASHARTVPGVYALFERVDCADVPTLVTAECLRDRIRGAPLSEGCATPQVRTSDPIATRRSTMGGQVTSGSSGQIHASTDGFVKPNGMPDVDRQGVPGKYRAAILRSWGGASHQKGKLIGHILSFPSGYDGFPSSGNTFSEDLESWRWRTGASPFPDEFVMVISTVGLIGDPATMASWTDWADASFGASTVRLSYRAGHTWTLYDAADEQVGYFVRRGDGALWWYAEDDEVDGEGRLNGTTYRFERLGADPDDSAKYKIAKNTP